MSAMMNPTPDFEFEVDQVYGTMRMGATGAKLPERLPKDMTPEAHQERLRILDKESAERKRLLDEARMFAEIEKHGFVPMRPTTAARGYVEFLFDWERPKRFRGRRRWKSCLYRINQLEWRIGIIDDDAYRRGLKKLGYDPYAI